MGKAPYNIEGLADQQDIDLFWSNPQPSDRDLFRKFYNYTLQTTQINGNFDGYFPFASVFKPVANLATLSASSSIPAISKRVNGHKSITALVFMLCKRLSLLPPTARDFLHHLERYYTAKIPSKTKDKKFRTFQSRIAFYEKFCSSHETKDFFALITIMHY